MHQPLVREPEEMIMVSFDLQALLSDADISELLRARVQERQPCVNCGETSANALLVAEHGRLAQRQWIPGQVVDLCHPCLHDVHVAIDGGEVADWLKPDFRDGRFLR